MIDRRGQRELGEDFLIYLKSSIIRILSHVWVMFMSHRNDVYLSVNLVEWIYSIIVKRSILNIRIHSRNRDNRMNFIGIAFFNRILMGYLNDLVSALIHLESLNIILRDLTLPNCLLFDEKTVKLSDYAKYDDRFVRRYVQQMPIRWLPGDIVTGVMIEFFLYWYKNLFLICRKNLGRLKRLCSCLVHWCSNYFIWVQLFRMLSSLMKKFFNFIASFGVIPNRIVWNHRYFRYQNIFLEPIFAMIVSMH